MIRDRAQRERDRLALSRARRRARSAGFGFFGLPLYVNQVDAGGAPPIFDPATLSLSGWWRASYGGSPWAGVASAGASGGRNLTEATNPPAVGAPLNGLTPADCDGTNDILNNATLMSTFLSTTAYAGWALVNADAVSTNSASGWANDAVAAANGGTEWVFYLRSSGLAGINHHDGAHKTVTAAFTIGAWQLVQFRFTGTAVQIRVNSGAWQSTAAGNVSSLAYALLIGFTTFGARFNGRIAELALAATSLDDATFDNIKSYVNARYALAL